ncbi:Type III pantothenate kinase [Frankliniella fusca]|uniref:Type III pantothenate kinase n=1 Tax=Frankliniella fusca TaxID=407009 RepID=A0AAE1H8B9_9NEOP|nr:Type III pantothenate kinase [Frankliniella fusca]
MNSMQVTSGFSKDNIKVEMKEEVIDLNEVVKYSDEESMVWETNKDDFMNNKTLLDMTCTAKGIEDACSATFETESNLAQLNLGSAFVRPELYYCPNSISASQSGVGQ